MRPPPHPSRAGLALWCAGLAATMQAACSAGQRPDEPAPRLPPLRPGQVWRNGLGMAFALVPAGEFLMGTSAAEAKALLKQFGPQAIREDRLAWEQPRHRVQITRAFLMSRHEVTVGQFRRFVQATGYKTDAERGGGSRVCDAQGGWSWVEKADAHWANPGFPQTDDHPVVCVSWNDAQAFCRWLNAADPLRPKGWAYRLPTEAEWEYAARGPQRPVYPWGDRWDASRANLADRRSELPWAHRDADDSYRRTAPVGSFSPGGDSPFRIADMAGNVWEWCLDRFDPRYYSAAPVRDPLNATRGGQRVERGGSWAFTADCCRAAYRFRLEPDASYDNLGFRAVLASDTPRTPGTPTKTESR